jgi:putative salt-induced outer membrane protein YdiY
MVEAVRLDWFRVARLESKDQFLIYLTDGTRFTDFFQLVATDLSQPDNFIIGTTNSTRVKQIDVLRLLPVESGFFRQLEGSIDFGFSFTSGNDQYQTELAASATYRRGKHSVTAGVDTLFSGQTEGSSTARKQFTVNYQRQLNPKWYVGSLFDLLSSDQQSLDRRVTVGGLVGRNFVQTEQTRLSVFGGLVGTREKYSVVVSPDVEATNADLLTGVDFSTFRFNRTDIRSRLSLFPSLTAAGRMRLQANTDLRIKIAKDLWWGFHIYENFDSKPPVRADKNDLGVSTSLGWKF